MKPELKKLYENEVADKLTEEFSYTNRHQVPVIEKIVLNSGVKALKDKNWVELVREQLSLIAAQQAVLTKAKKSISNFKLREGMPVGAMVTLRGDNMYHFLLRFLALALPGIRDFRGVPSKFNRGSYSLGITDNTIFPEIDAETNRELIGLTVTIVTSARTEQETRSLLAYMGMPFKKK